MSSGLCFVRNTPTLPIEIVDEIMAIAVGTFDPPTLSSIALTSNAYRILANETRFSSIDHRMENMNRVVERDCRRIDNLADVLKAGKLIDAMPPVDSFITSFSLTASGSTEELKPLLHSGSLSCIFDSLFRQTFRSYAPRSNFRKISLDIRDWNSHQAVSPWLWETQDSDEDEEDDEDYETTFLEWSLTSSPLTISFIHLLLNSQITHLRLNHIQNIPLNFLQGSNLQHFSLGGVSFSEPDEDHTAKQPVALCSIHIGGMARLSFEILNRLVCSHSVPMQNPFLFLKEATFDLGNRRHINTMNELLLNALNLESVCFCLYGDPYRGRDGWNINYSHLLHMTAIEFRIIDGGSSFPVITELLGYNPPPNLTTVKVSSNETHSNDTFEAARRSLETYPFNVLDKHLSCRSFENLDSIVIFFSIWINFEYDPRSFNVDAYREMHHIYVINKLPMCTGRDPTLSISVPIRIKMENGNGSIVL